MHRVPVVLALIVVLTAIASAQPLYSRATPSDKLIYTYFSKIIDESSKCLQNFLDENPSISLSLKNYNKTLLVKKEYEYYRSYGFKSNLSKVVGPFLDLTKSVLALRKAQIAFLKNSSRVNTTSRYLSAKTEISNMLASLDNIRTSINKIKEIELYSGSKKLKFDVSKIERLLPRIERLIRLYESTIPEKEGLYISVSNTHPYIHQNVTIYIYAHNVTNVTLFIDNQSLRGSQEIKYNFSTLGKHLIFAKGKMGNKTVTSNKVIVNVIKIPTHLLLIANPYAYVYEIVWIRTVVFDAFGRELKVKVNITYDSKSLALNTGSEYPLTLHKPGTLKVIAAYPGNETFAPSTSAVNISFLKYPVRIVLTANKTKVQANSSVLFSGAIYGTSNVSLDLVENSKVIEKIKATKSFNFTLKFAKPGKYKVWVYYPGSEVYAASTSNIVTVTVYTTLIPILGIRELHTYIIGIIVILFGILLVYYLLKYVKREKTIEAKTEPEIKEKIEEKRVEKVEVEETDIRKLYRKLFNYFATKHGLSKSLTPRELAKIVKLPKFDLLTELHEKSVYGGKKLSEDELKLFFKLSKDLLESSDSVSESKASD